MKIRFATSADYDELIRIGHAFFEFNPYRQYSELDNDSLKLTFDNLRTQHVLLIAEEEDKVVGAAAAFIAPVYWNVKDKQGVEAFWWIDPPYRKDGNGKRLRQALERVAKLRGVKFWNMIALTTSEPEKLDKMYKKAGFQHIENVYTKAL